MAEKKEDYGRAAILAGSTVGGAVAGAIAQSKIKLLDSTIGKVVLIGLALVLIARAKSDVTKGIGLGLAASGASSLIKGIAGGVEGFEALAGVDGAGVGQLVQDEDGMLYMVNGVGELEPYDVPLEGDEYEYEYEDQPFEGFGSTEVLV